MTGMVHVVDYDIGNLYSVARAIEKVGGEARLTANPAEISAADRLVLPGVGAFRDGMAGLRRAGVTDAIREFAATGRPLLGICLGMQMLATRSFEFGEHDGLDLIPGDVHAIPAEDGDGRRRKVPFVGWAALRPTRPAGLADTALACAGEGDSVYLVHSYHFTPVDSSDLLAVYDYDGATITAAVARGNVIGCQFHPEKSASVGLNIIRSFLAL